MFLNYVTAILNFYLLLMLLYYETEISEIQKWLNCFIKKIWIGSNESAKLWNSSKMANCGCKVWNIFWTQRFGLGQTFYHFVSFMNKIFCSAWISQLPISNNAGAYSREAPFRCYSILRGMFLSSLGSISQGCKNLPETNTLAYLSAASVTKTTRFQPELNGHHVSNGFKDRWRHCLWPTL